MIVYVPDLDIWILDKFLQKTMQLLTYAISVLQCDFMRMTLTIPAGFCFEPFFTRAVFIKPGSVFQLCPTLCPTLCLVFNTFVAVIQLSKQDLTTNVIVTLNRIRTVLSLF